MLFIPGSGKSLISSRHAGIIKQVLRQLGLLHSASCAGSPLYTRLLPARLAHAPDRERGRKLRPGAALPRFGDSSPCGDRNQTTNMWTINLKVLPMYWTTSVTYVLTTPHTPVHQLSTFNHQPSATLHTT